jgi:hypothetical protein
MTILYSIIGGLILGAGGTFFIMHKEPEPPPPIAESKIADKLTETELLEKPCSEKYISNQGDGLCREMFCLMMTRGIDSETSGQQCEQIANINNSLQILKACSSIEDDEQREDCIQVFRERK